MSNSDDNQPVQVEIIEKGDDWPEGISDGLTIPCRVCGKMPLFDYHVDDNLWSVLIPSRFRQSVVCLPCLDALGKEKGVHVGEYLRFMQFTGWNHTVVLSPSVAYRFSKREADTYTLPGKADHESSDGKSTAQALAEVDMEKVNMGATIRQQAEYIQRLEARLADYHDWHPMRSAPRDGTEILVYCESTGEQFVAFFNKLYGWQFAAGGRSTFVCHPSYWMPKPGPPQEEDHEGV